MPMHVHALHRPLQVNNIKHSNVARKAANILQSISNSSSPRHSRSDSCSSCSGQSEFSQGLRCSTGRDSSALAPGVPAPQASAGGTQMVHLTQEQPSHQPVPAGLKSTFSKIFSSNWGSENSGSGSSVDSAGGGLIAAFRAMMPKTSNSDSGMES